MNKSELVEHSCRKCGNAFSKPDIWRKRNGYICGECVNYKMRKYVADNKNPTKYKKQRPQLPRAERIAHIQNLKASPCLDCKGKFLPHQMDFDHVRGEKKFEICKGLRGGKELSEILEEIKKCDLVCANCHRDRTHQRKYRNSGRKRLH